MKNTAAQSLGRLGGSKTSQAKTSAARANGAKGGRPGYELFNGVLMMPVMISGKRRWTVKGMSGIWASQDAASSAAHYPTGRNVSIEIQEDGSVSETISR